MASGGSDWNVEEALSKLLQMGMVAELLKSFNIFGLKLTLQQLRLNPTTLGEAFFLARITEARFEDERPTIAIAKPNDLTARVQVQDLEQTTQGRGDEPNRIMLVTIHHMLYDDIK
ncbi:hypothetical protein Tco_0217690 [Tanacetum coccineum]